ncbi:protein neprosin [Quercus suber]|uniref:protein neprosin n=1 Tax=Quercus suber TaxID=58331 RepID=UPI0032E03B23
MISKITTLLVLLCMNSRMFSYGESLIKSLSEEDDIELERKVQRLNKTPKKSFQLENGRTIDCIDINKQPTLDHPSLKNHIVQRKPTSYAGEINKSSVKASPSPLASTRKSCPHGTVPIQRTTKDDLLKDRKITNAFIKAHRNIGSTDPLKHVNAGTPQLNRDVIVRAVLDEYHGISGINSIYNINVTGDKYTFNSMYVTNFYHSELNLAAAGTMVSTDFNGDSNHHLFVFWGSDTMDKSRGCYNTLCEGFVQVDSRISPGYAITPASVYNGDPLVEVKIKLYEDPKTGNWWIVFGEDNIAVGYYPKDFVHVYGAATMAWEGYTHSGSDGVSPPLGSGHRPDHIHNHAAYYRDMRFIKDNLAEEIPRDDELTSYVAPNCHSIDDLHYSGSPKWGYIFFYGGPGGDCVPA